VRAVDGEIRRATAPFGIGSAALPPPRKAAAAHSCPATEIV